MISKALNALNQIRSPALLSALSGVLYFVGFCGFDQFYLSWFCLIPILWALDTPSLSPRQALGIAWIFGFVTHLGGYTWIIYMLKHFGYLPIPAALGLYALLCLAQGSLLAAWGFGVFLLQRKYRLPSLITGPLLMVVCEWLYPALFPSYLANSQYKMLPLIQSADIIGLLGLGALMTLSSCVGHQWLRRWLKAGPAPASPLLKITTGLFVLLFCLNLAYGLHSLERVQQTLDTSHERVSLGLVQSNMGIYQKRSQPQEGLRRHQEQSLQLEAQGADLIIWPESGYYYPIPSTETNVQQRVRGALKTPLLFGGIQYDLQSGERRVHNTAFLTDAEGTITATYNKTYLLAFGEYLPLGDWFPWLYKLSPNTSHFYPGTHTHPVELKGVRYGVLICYEDILPRFVQKVMQENPHVLVNMTNDAWFGDSREPTIHLALAIFRSIEQRRYLVRATNTGVSAIISPTGEITRQSGTFERASLLGSVVPLQEKTFYSRWGDWVGYLSLLALVGMLIARRPSRSS
jgi:apolipoprotein N-acyltransferase